MNATISSRIAACLEQFEYMQSSGRLESREIEVPIFAWQDELGRLRLWVATTDAYQKTHFSLDHRLSDASHIKGQVIRQLDRLQRVLEDLQLALEEPFLEKTYSSETEDDESGKGIRSIYRNLVDSINSLYQMSILIRKPAPCDQRVSTKGKDAVSFKFHDRQHVSNSTLSHSLVAPLGPTISLGNSEPLRTLILFPGQWKLTNSDLFNVPECFPIAERHASADDQSIHTRSPASITLL